MRYQDHELRQTLAAEYVLGTLTGLARQRFEKLLEQDEQLNQLVSDWEQKLLPLSEGVGEVEVPEKVWLGIRKRLGMARPGAAEKSVLKRLWTNLAGTGAGEEGILLRFWRSLVMWRLLTATTTAVLMFALYLNLFAPKLVVNQYIAVIQNEQQQASWLARTDLKNKQIIIHVLNEQILPIGKAFELWMLPEGGSAPISMGLLSPSDNKTLVLTQSVVTRLSRAKGLAVSLEPSGGSPTGAPTGPVLYSGSLQSL